MSLTSLGHLHDAPDIINVVSPVLIVDLHLWDEVLIHLQMENDRLSLIIFVTIELTGSLRRSFFNIIQSPKVHVHCLVTTTVKSAIVTNVFGVDKKVNGCFAINHVIIYARICTLTLRFLLLCYPLYFYKTASFLKTTTACRQYYKFSYLECN